VHTWESIKLYANPGLATCSEKAWENSDHSPLADYQALSKQEVKAKAEL
jgi:hypothetical protein